MSEIHFGGCNGKLDSSSLLKLLRSSGSPITHRSDFFDAHLAELPKGATTLATSVDLVYDLGGPGFSFGSIAVAHCVSDLYATLSRPLVATITLGARPLDFENGRARDILAGAQDALKREGITSGGGHTVYSENTYVAISCIGIRVRAVGPALSTGERYTLLLSKPLGSGIYIAATRSGHLTSDEFQSAFELMLRSNADASGRLLALTESSPLALGFVTDVSGFGALMAVYGHVGNGWIAQIHTEAVPALPKARAMAVDHAAFPGLGERNLEWALTDTGVDTNRASYGEIMLLSDPQTSGGLLAAVTEPEAEFLTRAYPGWSTIGHVVPAEDDCGHRVHLY